MIHSCDTPGLLAVEDAISNMLSVVIPVNQTEQVTLLEAHGRALATDIKSAVQVPPADNSAMDGYAMRYQDLEENHSLKLVGTSLAGVPFIGEVMPGQCIRIMTGAIIPEGANAVVMQENTLANGDMIEFKQRPQAGNSIRKAGEDITQGQTVVAGGTKLTASHLALIASVGVAQVEVSRRLKVGIIATGDELTPPGKPLENGAIYESNRYALHALLASFSVEAIDFGIVEDDKASLRKVFEKANTTCDLVLSCGGVSVGDADYVKEILDELGDIGFWKVAIKPGKPFAFGKLKNALFCGLPGNPVSSYVTFEKLVAPLLEKLSGQTPTTPLYFKASAAQLVRKRPGRADYQRGIFYRDEQGKLWVKPNGKQGSGIMSSIANANCYIVLPKDEENIQQGDEVTIQPF